MEQVPGQVVADTKAPREWVGFNVSESLVGDKKPLDSRASGGCGLEGVPIFSALGPRPRPSHTPWLCFWVQALWSWGGSLLLGARADPLDLRSPSH